jgi:phage/plasmid-associated DNA primase
MTITEKYDNFKTRDEIRFVENVNLEYLEKICDNFDECYNSGLIGTLKDKKRNFKKIVDAKVVKTIIKNRLKNTSNMIIYTNNNNGRLYPLSTSCCSINKILRHTIAKDTNIDIDIVNCHPVLLYWYSKQKNISCVELEKYVLDRDNYILTLEMNKSEAKEKILTMINNQNFKPDEQLKIFYEEIKTLQKNICDNYKHTYQKCKKSNPINPMGSTMAHVLQQIENKVCQCMIQWCENNNIRITAPCFDGLMIYSEDVDNVDSVMSDIEQYVLDMLDIPIKLSVKDMNQDIQMEVNKIVEKQERQSISSEKIETKKRYFNTKLYSEEYLGKYILKNMIDDEVLFYHSYKNEIYIYNENNKLFERRRPNTLMTYITSYLDPYFDDLDKIIYSEEEGKISEDIIKEYNNVKRSIHSTNKQKCILIQITSRLELYDKSEFIDKTFNRIPYLFPIKNGKIVDMSKNIVRQRTKQDFFTFYSNVDYNIDVDEQPVKDIIRQYLIPKNKTELSQDDIDHIESYLSFLGYLATGYNHLKKIAILKGVKDSGKTTISKRVNKMFGDFCQYPLKNVIIDKGVNSVHQTELFSLSNGTRVAFTSELDETDRPQGALLKRISGDDKLIPARKCGSPDQVLLNIDCKFVIPTNYVFETTDQALQKRLIVFQFVNTFPCVDNYDQMLQDIDFESVIFKYANRFITNNKTIKWSKQCLSYTEETMDQTDCIKNFINQYIEFTNNEKDKLKRSFIFDLFKKDNENELISKNRNKFYNKFLNYIPNKLFIKRDIYHGMKLKNIENNVEITEDDINEEF